MLEHEINTQKLKAMDNETQLRAKISLLESELAELEKARQAAASEVKSKVVRAFFFFFFSLLVVNLKGQPFCF